MVFVNSENHFESKTFEHIFLLNFSLQFNYLFDLFRMEMAFEFRVQLFYHIDQIFELLKPLKLPL